MNKERIIAEFDYIKNESGTAVLQLVSCGIEIIDLKSFIDVSPELTLTDTL